jgi:hypothetical protein
MPSAPRRVRAPARVIDIDVWLPAGPTAVTPANQAASLVEWLDARQDRRELHFHWVDGMRDVDGLPAPHRPAYDRVYLEALDIDYAALTAQMDARSGGCEPARCA